MPDFYPTVADTEGVARDARCPACGRKTTTDMLVDLSGLPGAETFQGHAVFCDADRERLFRTLTPGRIRDWFRALGANPGQARRLERAHEASRRRAPPPELPGPPEGRGPP